MLLVTNFAVTMEDVPPHPQDPKLQIVHILANQLKKVKGTEDSKTEKKKIGL